MSLKYVHSSPLEADHILGFLGKGHFLKISQALLAMSSIGKTLWTEVNNVESQVPGFIPAAFKQAALPLEGMGKLSCSGKPGGKRAVARLFFESVEAYLIVAMYLICSRYRSVGITDGSADRTIVLAEYKQLVIYLRTRFMNISV